MKKPLLHQTIGFSIAFFLLLDLIISPVQSKTNINDLPPSPKGYEDLSRESVWEKANEYYRNTDLEKALAGYLYLTELGIKNGYLFYNLGNVYFRLGEVGKSILWYERAKYFLPRYSDLKFNYDYARNKLTDEEFKPTEYGGTIGFLIRLHEAFNLPESLWITVGCLWTWMSGLILSILIRSERWKNWLKIPCWIIGIAFILSSLSSGMKIYAYENVPEAIVMDSAVEIKTGPGKDFSTSFSLHEGTKVRVVQQQGEWSRIVMPGNVTFNGWVPNRSLETIRPIQGINS